MSNRIAKVYRQFVLQHPVIVILLLFCIFVFFTYHAQSFKLDASADSLLLENDQDLKMSRQVAERYQTKDILFVTFTPNVDLFSQSSLDIIKQLRDELQEIEGIESVISLVDVPLVRIAASTLSELAQNYKTLEDASVDRESAKQELMQSPIFSELILGTDGQTTALILNLPDNKRYTELVWQRTRLIEKKIETGLSKQERRVFKQVETEYDGLKQVIDDRNHQAIEQIRSVLESYRGFGELHMGGVPMIADDMINFIKNDLVTFGIGVFVFLVVLLLIIFHQLRWVLLPLLSCVYSGLIMIGLLGLVDWRVTVISSNFISLMLILTMSMNIHLIVRYRELLRDHPDSDQFQLVFMTTKKMVQPCLYTSLTTMIGFCSLFISDIKPVVNFGWMMAIGLMVAFTTTFLLFPSLLILLDKTARSAATSKKLRLTAWMAGLTERHGQGVLVVSVLLVAISVYGMNRLEVENSFINYFNEDTEIYQGQLLIDEKLGGTTPLDIILDFDIYERMEEADEQAEQIEDQEFKELEEFFADTESDPADAWFTLDKMDRIRDVHNYLETIPAVGKVLSLGSFLKLMQEVNYGEEAGAFELALIYKRMPEELKEVLIDPYISIDENQARVTLRIIDSLPDLRRKELLEKIEADLMNNLALQEQEFTLSGLLVLYNNMLQSLFRSQILTLGVVMLGILLMLLILLRSISLAIIGIIPNILSALFILGVMGLLDIPLDMMTITIAAITIGIAVDDTIHYIYRFREEFPKNGDYVATMHYCHANIGRAMYFTSVTIMLGFSILVMSNFIPTIYFGLLTMLAMWFALVADLALLPKLLMLWKPFGQPHASEPEAITGDS